MELITKVSQKRNGGIDIEFNYTETFRILREELNFRHTTIESKRNFILKDNGVFQIVPFKDLEIAFREYLRSNYDSLDIPKSISLEKLINATFIKTPIYFSSNTLRRELEDDF